jgi:hypothetical protein
MIVIYVIVRQVSAQNQDLTSCKLHSVVKTHPKRDLKKKSIINLNKARTSITEQFEDLSKEAEENIGFRSSE